MRLQVLWCVLAFCSMVAFAQQKDPPVTVPMTIDHNRIVIEVGLPLPDGTTVAIRAWVDNGDPELHLSRHMATLMGLPVSCDDKQCSSPAPVQFSIAAMSIATTGIKQAQIPLKPVSAASILAPGMNVEMSIPSSILRHYDVLIDYPGRKFTIGPQGSLHFRGSMAKVEINPENGLIQVPAKIENKKYNLALDLGASVGFLSDEIFDKLWSVHPDWPRMTGGVGPANMWGSEEESKWKVMRLDRVEYGPLFLTDVALVEFPKERFEYFAKRAGVPTLGLLGANVMQNYRIGLDYAHSVVYFDIGRLFNFPEFDVIGLILHPEDDGRYSILSVADINGKPSLRVGDTGAQPGDHLIAIGDIPVRGSTMGQVWSMLGGNPGQERKLTLERAGRQFVISAPVQHFLAINEDDEPGKKKSKKR